MNSDHLLQPPAALQIWFFVQILAIAAIVFFVTRYFVKRKYRDHK